MLTVEQAERQALDYLDQLPSEDVPVLGAEIIMALRYGTPSVQHGKMVALLAYLGLKYIVSRREEEAHAVCD